MALKIIESINYQGNALIPKICGLWDVVHVSENADNDMTITVTRRDSYLFLIEKLYVIIKLGGTSNGSWELAEKELESDNQYSIILDSKEEFIIKHLEGDEMILSRDKSEIKLAKRL